jgi:two-component system, chemotaxis family, sensor kinase CheA
LGEQALHANKTYLKHPASKRRVLLVDDSALNRTLQKHLLLKEGYEVLSASGGIEAWELLLVEQVDLVVTDAMMPDLDGYELTAMIKNDPRTEHLPVVLVSGLERATDQQHALDIGADAYIPKTSADLNGLIEAIQRLIG